jgi:membrane-bound lytic murein transglycosylase D
MKNILLFASIFFTFSLLAQTKKVNEGEAFVKVVEQSLNQFYAEYAKGPNYDSIMKSLNYEANEVPSFSDEMYCQRIQALANSSPMPFECNEQTLSMVNFFAKNRRNFAKVVLGRGALYFDMFEEKLASHNMPIELKYLAVIESGLRPQVKSRVGAMGLWQFMYRTGLMFGLEENSYIDERMDPELATEAACLYLKQLHGIYNDWFLALAAYNAGPGNVNKAIRRSGGKTNYWDVRPYLPNETQGYVPNFVAATYLLTYHKEHNIIPYPAKVHFSQLDTMCLNIGVDMKTISSLTGWDIEEIKTLNPIYKTTFIPKTTPPQCITGPLEQIGMLVSMEKELYEKLNNNNEVVVSTPETQDNATKSGDNDLKESKTIEVIKLSEGSYVTHTVRRGESLAVIARNYKVTVEEIKTWNGIEGDMLYAGQKIKITGKEGAVNSERTTTSEVKKYYSVKRGNTFGVIASRHGLTQTQLKNLNPGISISRLNVGQRIRVK